MTALVRHTRTFGGTINACGARTLFVVVLVVAAGGDKRVQAHRGSVCTGFVAGNRSEKPETCACVCVFVCASKPVLEEPTTLNGAG